LNLSALPFLFQEELYLVPEKTLVILARNWEDYTAEHKLLLSKILSSVRLSASSVQVIVQSTLSLDLIASYKPSKVLVFGSATTGINLYEPCQIEGFALIKADDLLHLDDSKKKNLWTGLKNMFGV
jgi:hypothetical protein